jgi:hypothetical protein
MQHENGKVRIGDDITRDTANQAFAQAPAASRSASPMRLEPASIKRSSHLTP